MFAGFSRMSRAAFDLNGERRVSRKSPVWFRNGGYGKRMSPTRGRRINRKFTANRNRRIFREFSKN
jgi:hypothetical protein